MQNFSRQQFKCWENDFLTMNAFSKFFKDTHEFFREMDNSCPENY